MGIIKKAGCREYDSPLRIPYNNFYSGKYTTASLTT